MADTPLAQLSDEDLMDQLQAGEARAFDVLYERHKDKLILYLRAFRGTTYGNDDLVQDAFLRAYVKRFSYNRGLSRFTTWIYTITRNLAISEHRKSRSAEVPSDFADDLPCDNHSPERRAGAGLQGEYIQQALALVKPLYREYVVFRDIQQLTYSEIAEITGAPLGSVKSRINRGRTMLRHMLADIYNN